MLCSWLCTEGCSIGVSVLLATPEIYSSVRELHTIRTLASALLYITTGFTTGSIVRLSTPCSRVIYLSANVLSAKPHTHVQSFVDKHLKGHLWHTYL